MNNDVSKKNKKLTFILLLAALLMLGFGYLLVPLYNVLCKNLGINGKTDNNSAVLSGLIDNSRSIKVEFLSTINDNLKQFEFYSKTPFVTVHPGENKPIYYYLCNHSANTVTVQAIPSIAPAQAAIYLKKTECFCFEKQTIQANTCLNMPLIFHIDTQLPDNIHEISLAYTLFKTKSKLTPDTKAASL